MYTFFFQAEDGIRDGTVTGVQTCALPIWRRTTACSTATSPSTCAAYSTACGKRRGGSAAGGGSSVSPPASSGRSEERRVGKECRSRWSPYEQKENTGIMSETNMLLDMRAG